MDRIERVEERLRSLLWQHAPETVFRGGLAIVFTRNASTLISLYRRGATSTLRLHRVFAIAPPAILESIVLGFFTEQCAPRARRLRARIMDFVERNRKLTLATTATPRLLPPRGRHYDLEEIYLAVVREHVPERDLRDDLLRVGWSPRSTPSLMGKWIETPARSPNLIAVNPLLDDRRVPRYYLEYIVYHEVLHDLYPIRRDGGRWVQHPVEFRRRERAFPDYARAQRWERERLAELV